MKLIKTYKDEKRIYFLTEFINGKDMFDTLRAMPILGETEAKFYIAAFILILEHLQERDIVHRDLKPENVMIDDQGYPKLIDFGTAKFVEGRTFTIVGTPHYMAPEVILGKGYGMSADMWSFGCMAYEFICGQVPFGEDLEDAYKVYEAVLTSKVVFPRLFQRTSPM